MHKFNASRSAILGSASFIALALATAPSTASAQAAASNAVQVEQVVVTASRIVRDGYEAPTPTTVVGAADIQKLAPANIADAVNQLPAVGNAAGSSNRTVNFTTAAVGGTNSFNLRNLGTARTLTLLDGHRSVGANLTGVVDVNSFPSNLVSRVDVVTGGASAAWGSDAVAGVINFVLDKEFTGVRANINYGQSWLADGNTFSGDLAFGMKFADGRGHFLLSGRKETVRGIDQNTSRHWYSGYKAVPNTAHTATNGIPGFIGMDQAGLRLATSGGVITSGPLAGVQFGTGGTVLPYRLAISGSGIIGAGGDVEDIGGQYPLLGWAWDSGVFARVSYDLTDNINVYVEGSKAWSDGLNHSSHYILHGTLNIKTDNAFIPAALNVPAGLTSFNIGRVQNETTMGPTRVYNARDQRRLLFGVEGKQDWFDNSFKWNAYYQVGTNKQYIEITHSALVGNFMQAVDAVRNPAVGGVPGIAPGTPVCRSTLTSPTNGCIPFNPFGQNSASAAAQNYVAGAPSYQTVYIQQSVASGSVQFEPFSLPAGKLSVAAGYEWRREVYHNVVDPIDAAALPTQAPFWFGNYKVGRGRIKVNEYFVEVVAPILKDVPFAKQLDFNGAVRKTDYSSTGKVTTWKYGATWDVFDDLRLRGTKSRDIRAPNLNDLYLGATGSGVGVLAPGTNSQVFINTLNGGNPNLQNEIADTTAAGVIYRPGWFPGFSASVDYYKIGINQAIITPTPQQIVNLCYGVGQPANTAACANVLIKDPAGSLAGAIILVAGANIARFDVAGYDYEFSYRRPLEQVPLPFVNSLPGSIDLRSLITHQTKFSQTVGTTVLNLNDMVFSGTFPVAGGAEWRALTTATYVNGPSSTTVAMRWIGPSVVNHEPLSSSLSVAPNDIKSITYFDLAETWNVDAWGVNAQLYAKIENFFDSKPPKIPSTQGTAYAASGTNGDYFDLIGRFWRVGARFKF